MSDRILIVDDEPVFRETFRRVLCEEGFDTRAVADAAGALAELERSSYDVLISDLQMPGGDGLGLLRVVTERSPHTACVLITAYGSTESAVEALRLGAVDYLAKPIDFDDALFRLRRILERRDRLEEIRLLRRDVQRTFDFENLVGRTPGMQAVFDLIGRVAATTSTVLITGESGTGKELVARAIHHADPATRDRRFVPVNCAAIPDALLESELFGHARGSFTGAVAEKKGLFEVASGGTIFLDEIAEMSPVLQAKFLRAIEEKEIVRVGAVDPIKVDARIVCSTHRDLRRFVDEGRFREDLYWRVNVVEIHLPPLRDRREDIPLLIAHFIEKYNRELKRAYDGVESEAVRALSAYEWRGNVRELENVIERAMILGDGRRIRMQDLPPGVGSAPQEEDPEDLRAAVRNFETRHIRRVLEQTGGNKEEAARLLGIAVSSLYRKMEEPTKAGTT